MNALVMLKYGHGDVVAGFEGLTEDDWARAGVTSRWSPKDLLAHLASSERMVLGALQEVAGGVSTSELDAMRADRDGFNEAQVQARRDRTPAEVMAEYASAHGEVLGLVERLGPERLREPGTIPWYGAEYALDDLLVYANYAHKREHCAQMRRWRLDRAAKA